MELTGSQAALQGQSPGECRLWQEVICQAPPRAGGVAGQGRDAVGRGGSGELEAGTLLGGMGRPGGFLGRRDQGRAIRKEKI